MEETTSNILKRNTSPEFVGIAGLKAALRKQLEKFEGWAVKGTWEEFHHDHYDWWMFPVNRRSSQGRKWTVCAGDIAELKADPDYIRDYLRGVDLVAASMGWDVHAKAYVKDPAPGQSWHNWPVRLYKMAQSIQLFGFETEFESLKLFALDLMRQGRKFEYHSDLSWLFTGAPEPGAAQRNGDC